MDEENKKKAYLEKIVQLVVFRLDREEYAVPVRDVQTVINMVNITPIPNSLNFMAGLINWRGKVIPVIDLEKRFNLHRDNVDIQSQHIMVIDVLDSQFGVIVDEVVEVLRISSEIIQDTPETINSKIGTEYIQGVIIIDEEEHEDDKSEAKDDNAEANVTKNVNSVKQRIVLILDLKNAFTEKEKQKIGQAQN
jgi:purine-binding chemotaxis protein CheW